MKKENSHSSIEDIILDHDRRGVSALRHLLPADYCRQASRFALEHKGTTFIVTGFYIITAGAPETDGPPGAIALGNALSRLGFNVMYISDRYTVPVLRGLAGASCHVVEFPITDHEESTRFARELLNIHKPSLLISTERCSLTCQKVYRNMRGVDISDYTAKLDYLFIGQPNTIGVGDGGNEIGMGKLAREIPNVPTLPKDPAVVATTHLVIASVSNWGCYGLVAALSLLSNRSLLPSVEEDVECIKASVRLGCVDGFSGQPEPKVDSFTLEENGQILTRLHELLKAQGISGQFVHDNTHPML